MSKKQYKKFYVHINIPITNSDHPINPCKLNEKSRDEKLEVLQVTRHSHMKSVEVKQKYDDEPTNSDLKSPD